MTEHELTVLRALAVEGTELARQLARNVYVHPDEREGASDALAWITWQAEAAGVSAQTLEQFLTQLPSA